MKQNISEEIISLSNEDLLKLYDLLVEHQKYLVSNILTQESEGKPDENK